ncbi:MAG: NHL repeat-containing protein [Candidatus Aminicenantaceae bacterium]
MKKSMNISICLMAILFFVLSPSLAQKVETVDGVQIIHNEAQGQWGKNPQVELEFIKTIGEMDSLDDAVIFFMPTDIAFDSQGNIYILDSGNHRIQKFSPEGKYIATIGRQGQGPGEFQYPQSLSIDSEGYLYISDMGNRKIHVLKPGGGEYNTIQMNEQGVGNIRWRSDGQIVMGGGGGLMMIGAGGMMEDQDLGKLLTVLDSEGNIVQEFGEKLDYKDFLMNGSGNKYHFAVDKIGNVYVAFDVQNRIDKYSPEGELLWKSDRKLNFEVTSPKKKSGSRKVSGGMVEIKMPQMNRCANGIAVDDKGRVWVTGLNRQFKEEEKVQTSITVNMDAGGKRSMSMKPEGNTDVVKTDAFRLEIYSPEGMLLGKIQLGHFVDDILINGDKIYMLDKMRGSQYYEYKIIEK